MRTKILFLLLSSFAIQAGCSDASKPTVTAPAPARPQTVSAVSSTATTTQPAVEEQPVPVYAYNPAGRRDPFTPIIIKEEKKALLGAKTPLERFPISEFKLSGIVWGGLGYHAMLEGPDGKGYFVKKGTRIGPNRGVVKRITERSMVIEERYKDLAGQESKREIIVELSKK
jgi:type IV pilus assembly protein PilP